MSGIKRQYFCLLPLLVFSNTFVESGGNCVCPDNDANFIDPLPKIVKVDEKSHQFIDSFGRTRWFHGTNVVTKEHPYHPDLGQPDVCNQNMSSPFCDADMNYLQQLGVNVVRLGVMWAGAEPVRADYNCTYFCVMHGIIQKLASRGIYTLVDVHQDVLARQMCGEGVPDWFMKKDWIPSIDQRFPVPMQAEPFTTDENGIPDPWDQCWSITDWFLSYLTVAAGDAFQKLYTNYDGLMDSFTDYWAKIASEYRSYNSVLGYDLLNEPWAGNIYTDPSLLIPGVADRKNLDNLWQNCSQKIRTVDTETLIFFEGVTWDILDGHVSVPGYDGTKAAMGYHYYAPPQLTLQGTFKNRLIDQNRLGTGGILTEFRMWAAEGAEEVQVIDSAIRNTVDMADIYLQSWMGWGYRSVLNRDKQVAKHYARTYAPAVAGFVDQMGFNEDTGYYFIIWRVNTTIEAPTEIKINTKIYYPDGFILTIRPVDAATWEAIDDQNINLKYTDKAIDGQVIRVEITQGSISSTEEITAGAESPKGHLHIFVHLIVFLFLSHFH